MTNLNASQGYTLNRQGLTNDQIARKLDFFDHMNKCFSRYGVTIPPEHVTRVLEELDLRLDYALGAGHQEDSAEAAEVLEQSKWNVDIKEAGGDPDEGTAYIIAETDASDLQQADDRVKAYVGRNFEDDLRGAKVVRVMPVSAGRYRVMLYLAKPRG